MIDMARDFSCIFLEAVVTQTLLKIDPDQWLNEAQEGEFKLQRGPNVRDNDKAFLDGTNKLFQRFGFKPNDFASKTVIDLGAGSRLRALYFNDARIIAIEPLADKFRNEMPWYDLDKAAKVYSLPAEEKIVELENTSDLIFSINVLDHCYDFEAISKNILAYMKPNSTACLSFDCHHKVDKCHPIIINEKVATEIFFDLGFRIKQFTRTSSYHKAISDYSITFWMTKPEN